MKRPFRWILGMCVAALVLIGLTPAYAQTISSAPAVLSVTAADKAAASTATRVHRHARSVSSADLGNVAVPAESLSDGQRQALAGAIASQSSSSSGNATTRYPGDLHNFGGPTVQAAQSHNIYVNARGGCQAPGCWGNPEQFLRDLANSDFIHVTDQYTGQSSDHRYTLGGHALVSLATPTPAFTDNDMLAIVHAVIRSTNRGGYGHIYHLFLTPGTDECFDNTFTVCYSPDNPATFFFCAYHGSVDFSDLGHALYSVEPYQNIPGCWVEDGTPNGRLVDSTNDVLSHELIETITDPDGTGWWQYYGGGMFGEEIGDECVFLSHNGDRSGAPFVFRMAGRQYAAQPEYDNSAHGCTARSD